MDNPGYIALTRQSGLMREMQAVAHNLANLSTAGYRRESVLFTEYVRRLEGGAPSLSMAAANARHTSNVQGALEASGGPFDVAIEGEGFFLIETPEGERLTRAGAFRPNLAGELVTADGHLVLDAGGAPIFVPPDARNIGIAPDGTISADGAPVAQLGLVRPVDPLTMQREAGVLMRVDGPHEPVEDPAILQGYLEASNVDPMTEMARMIAVSRAYELGQTFLDREDERIRAVITTLGRSA
ncbi:MAG: flagellar hook-basal body complex protein [Alkalilacustris sp.]